MAPQEPSNLGQRAAHEPLYEIDPRTGASIEVFHADHSQETFGRRGAGWFWCFRRRGAPSAGAATGPFPTSYAAYRDALNAPVIINS
jgi:hypothetical protein